MSYLNLSRRRPAAIVIGVSSLAILTIVAFEAFTLHTRHAYAGSNPPITYEKCFDPYGTTPPEDPTIGCTETDPNDPFGGCSAPAGPPQPGYSACTGPVEEELHDGHCGMETGYDPPPGECEMLDEPIFFPKFTYDASCVDSDPFGEGGCGCVLTPLSFVNEEVRICEDD